MRKGTAESSRGDAYAAVLARAFAGVQQLDATLNLLRASAIDREAAELDSHLRQTRRYVDAVESGLAQLDRRAFLLLQAAADRQPVVLPKRRPRDGLIDAVATWLMLTLRRWPTEAAELAVATGRLIEESRTLQPGSRRTVPLGRGFEEQMEDRLRRRFALLPEHQALVAALDEHRQLLLEAPDEGLDEIEREVGRELSGPEREWFNAERFAGMLYLVRHDKTEGGQIRWFLRRDPAQRIVLDRYGAHGHWLVAGDADRRTLARSGTIAARVTDEARAGSDTGWRALIVSGDSTTRADPNAQQLGEPLALDEAHTVAADDMKDGDGAVSIAMIRRGLSPTGVEEAEAAIVAASRARTQAAREPHRLSYALTVDDEGLALAPADRPRGVRSLGLVSLEAGDDALLDFLDLVGRVADAATIVDRIDDRYDHSEAVRWTRALLTNPPDRPARKPSEDLSDLNVRLVYVPASQPHPLGGLPLIGLRFVADHLERAGARADIVSVHAKDFERRLVELLGADVIGLSVYLTNREEVAKLVKLLRGAGFQGRIVLGGPELRDIDLVGDTVPGWDALIRGEGEAAFPQVLRVLRHLDAGETGQGLALARTLSGVALAHGDLVIMADTATRNAVPEIRCPLPFEWQRQEGGRTLKMNFTRGCPYACGFCPNHQGQKFHSCGPDEIWAFAEMAAADALRLPRAEEVRCAAAIQDALGMEAPPRLRLALNVLLRRPVSSELLERVCAEVHATANGRSTEKVVPNNRHSATAVPGAAPAAESGSSDVTPWHAKRTWLSAKSAALPTFGLDGAKAGHADGSDRSTLEPFELMTSEDNTLVNRAVVLGLMRRRRDSGLADAVVFNPGQNTVRDLTDRKGGVDTEYVDLLSDSNPFKIVLGVDATSNPVLRQNHKPYYSIAEAVAVNSALARRGIEVLNNYILLTPETDLLEAIEAMALFVLLPIRWRDHGPSINLRITKEPGTQSHDEGLLFAPDDSGYDDPLRFPDVEALLKRWDLDWSVNSADLPELLWRVLAEDEDARRLLPLVVRRWERDFDDDPFLVTLAARIRAAWRPDAALVEVLREIADVYEEGWLSGPEPEVGARAALEPSARDRAETDRRAARRRSKTARGVQPAPLPSASES
jgi:hypothetical protein